MSSIISTIFTIALIVFIIVIIVKCINVVPQANAWILERFGKYKCTWNAGLHLKVPIIDRIAKRVSLKEQVADFEPQPVITQDNVTMMVDTVVFF